MATTQTAAGELIAEALSNLLSLPDDALVTTKEAASILRLKPATLGWSRCHGGGPAFVRVGPKAIRYRMRDLRAYTAGA